MLLKDISFPTPEENILFDEVLLFLAEKGQAGEVLRFWESPVPFIVLGRTGKEEDDIYLQKAKEHHIPVLRRASGGGTVLQGKGCLNYSLVLPQNRHPGLHDIRRSYQYILGRLVTAFKSAGLEICFMPTSDLALVKENKKFSGNAQKRGKKFILHHGTMLYDFDLDMIEHFLKIPKDVPLYRQDRTHKDFVMNLPVNSGALKTIIRQAFGADKDSKSLADEELDCLRKFLSERKIKIY